MEAASLALGKFSALIEKIPNPTGYIVAFTRQEATQSSRIEGTQTDIEDAFKSKEDIDPEKRDDWQELQSYIQALDSAVEKLNTIPLCNRLIKKTHKILLSHSRGKNKQPGEFRQSQNWIGGSRPSNAHFVPVVTEYVDTAMDNLEKFIQDTTLKIPHLIKAALIHYQFETIHPFLDGNGRIGRMVISLYLLENKILKHPILYISDYFENNRQSYYDALDNARKSQEGIVKWISFFMDGVYQTATKGIKSTQHILDLKENITNKILTLGRIAKNAQRLLELLFDTPVINSSFISRKLTLSPQSSHTLIAKFIELNILIEMTGYKRNRVFLFKEYLDILSTGE